ncbi:endoplasmic reticulum membrane sensor NFE2L1a [Eucyclogobius newberryi]|uniref:endoplasmic reticulum membrane sensor NFE2L1a n=1 Tax=Eucyclogobius newberryi TaxID=166745 RepID=UPI003B5C0AC8
MQCQKKRRLLEGLIQAALLLSLCGMRVDVDLEPGPESLMGPTSALAPATRLHNLRNALESGVGEVHPKHPDLDLFFTSRRLLGWVRSLDRLQVPQAELETWLVQQEPTPLPVRLRHTTPNNLILPEQSRGQEWEEPQEHRGQEWEEPEQPEDIHLQVYRQHLDTEEQDLSPALTQHMETEDAEDAEDAEETEDNLSSASLWECLRLLEDSALTHGLQELVCNTETPAPPESTPTDLEQQWQDLLELIGPQTGDVDVGSPLEQTSGSQVTAPAEQGGPLLEAYLQHRAGSDQELLPLLPSDQLDDPTPDPLRTPPAALSTDPSFLLDEADLEELSGGLEDILGDAYMLEEMSRLDQELEEGFSEELSKRLEEQGYLDRELSQRTSWLSLSRDRNMEKEDIHTVQPDDDEELDSDSGLSLDSSHIPPSPSNSEASSSYCSTSSSTSQPSSMELEFTIKEEPLEEEELGAVGGQYYPHHDSKHIFSSTFHSDQKLFDDLPWLEQINHDHTYSQPQKVSPNTPSKHLKFSPKDEKPYHHPKHQWNRDERHARTLRIPFSNELIVSLPVEEFNDLLANYQLDEDQLNLVRDIRRRGKNKIAAQNCRKRKMDTLEGLEKDVTGLKKRRSRLLKDKQEALRTLQELKQRMSSLYQDVFSSLRDDEGRPLDVHQYMLSFESDGSVDVVSRRQRSKEKSRRKQKDKK